MFDSIQCILARMITNTEISDTQINKEFKEISDISTKMIIEELDILLKKYNVPIDQGFKLLVDDIAMIASKYNISSTTLFCIYMNSLHN